MTAIVKDSGGAMAQVTEMLDVALRTAAQLKNARGLLPESLKTEGEICAVLLAGAELGVPPMAALRGLQVVRGKVIISYDLMVGLLRRAGYKIEWLAASATKAQLRLTAPDGTQHTEAWDQERAKKAGLWGNKGPWSQYPETMLKARCVSSAARAFAGEVLAGVYCEEAAEIGPSAQVMPIRTVEARGETDGEIVDAETGEVHEALPATFGKCKTIEQMVAWIEAKRATGGSLDGARIHKIVRAKVGDATPDELEATMRMIDTALGVQRAEPDAPSDDAHEAEAEAMAAQYDD